MVVEEQILAAEDVPDPDEKALTVYMPLELWDHRYHRHSRHRGNQIAMIERNPALRAAWTCLLPDQEVKNCKTDARSAFSTNPLSGVSYTPMLVLARRPQRVR